MSPFATLMLLKIAVLRLFDDEALPLAGNIAYRILFAAFPFLIFLTTMAGLFGSPDLAQKIVTFLIETAPPYLVAPISRELHSVLSIPQKGLLTLSVFITLWSAMGGVDSIRVCLNRAYDLKETRSSLHLYALSCFIVITTTISLLLVAFLGLISPLFVAYIHKFWPEASLLSERIHTIRYPLSLGLLAVILLVFHLYLPAGKRKVKDVWVGILFTIVSWSAMATLYGYYLVFFPTFTKIYAGLGGIAAALFFLYMAAIVLILGGELNRVLSIRKEKFSILEIALEHHRNQTIKP